MNILKTLKQYLHFKRKGMRSAFKYSLNWSVSTELYYLLVMALCVIGVLVTLRFADWIDGIHSHANNMRDAAMYNQQRAIHHEATIASILNGAAIINGRIVTFCQLNAAGECRK